MIEYRVDLEEIIRKNIKGEKIIEIWARIINLDTKEKIKKLIWWKNSDGIFHDESGNIPTEFRSIIDNEWMKRFR